MGDRPVRSRWYARSAYPPQREATAGSLAVAEHLERLTANRRDHLIARADRVDPSKNLLRGVRPFDIGR